MSRAIFVSPLLLQRVCQGEDSAVTLALPLLMIEVREYIDARGRIPYRDWLTRLDTAALRMEQDNFSAAKGVGSGVYELRLDFGPGYQVYFGKDGEQLVLLLGGGTKR